MSMPYNMRYNIVNVKLTLWCGTYTCTLTRPTATVATTQFSKFECPYRCWIASFVASLKLAWYMLILSCKAIHCDRDEYTFTTTSFVWQNINVFRISSRLFDFSRHSFKPPKSCCVYTYHSVINCNERVMRQLLTFTPPNGEAEKRCWDDQVTDGCEKASLGSVMLWLHPQCLVELRLTAQWKEH